MRACVLVLLVSAAGLIAGCGPGAPDPPPPLAPGQFAFGVFGDGPYRAWEERRFDRLIEDVNGADIEWLIHVGDILWYPCSDEAFAERKAQLDAVRRPVVYTPGDNEWTDCHEDIAGGYPPLDRLAALRRIFFSNPRRSLGAHPMALETQADTEGFETYVENARWSAHGVVFTTIHQVGSGNGLDGFPSRTAREDEEVARRSDAALAWLADAFRVAAETSAGAVVIALHADMGFDPDEPWRGHGAFLDALSAHIAAFDGQVLLVHGDSHEYITDQPLTDAAGRPYPNFTRVETVGSPDIGWVRVVMDEATHRVVRFELRMMSGWG